MAALVYDDILEVVGGRAPRLEDVIARGKRTENRNTDLEMSGVHAGVTVGWLAQAFHMNPNDVKRKLARCPILKAATRGYIYELKVAAQYLVKPEVDIEEYLKTMKVSELPTRLQSEYWAAMRAKQQWEKEAASLWLTEDVVEVLGDVFATIKFSAQLFVDDLERSSVLTQEQRQFIIDKVDDLQATVYRKLVEMPKQRKTHSSRKEALMDPVVDDHSDVV